MIEIPRDTIHKAAEGDMAAFECIYKAASGLVFTVALRVVGNWQTAQEVTQDVFLKIHSGLGSFEFKSSLKTWIYRITVNTAINARKYAHRGTRRTVSIEDGVPAAELACQPPDIAAKIENEHTVETLLEKLSPEQRAAIVLRELEGLCYEEMARVLHVNINTVRSRLKRARAALAKLAGTHTRSMRPTLYV